MTTNPQPRDCRAVIWPPDDDPELQKIAAAYQREYEVGAMLDRELGLSEGEVGNDLMVRATAVLKRRGIALADATQAEFRDALLQVSP